MHNLVWTGFKVKRRVATQAMKIFFAYTLVVIGIPYLLGMLIGQIVSLPVSLIWGLITTPFRKPMGEANLQQEFSAAAGWAIRGPIKMPLHDRIMHFAVDMFVAIGQVLTAGFIFHLFGLTPTVFIPLIIVAWEVLIMLTCKQSYRVLFGGFTGLIIGWILIERLFN